MAIRRVDRLPKRKVTVDEIIRADDITDLLADIHKNRARIDQFVLVYTDDESECHTYWDGSRERLVYALEQAKHKIMFPPEEE